MKKWRCSVCGHIHKGDSPPERCPVCGAPKEKFELIQDTTVDASQPPESGGGADVLVVGSGAAAFATAATAVKHGASVIMLEKADSLGGTTVRSGGGFWIPLNKWQKEAGYEDNREDALRYMARYSYPNLYRPDAERFGLPQREYALLEAYVDNGAHMVSDFDNWDVLHSIMEVNWTGKGQVDYQDHLPENKGIRGRTIYPRNKDGNIAVSGMELVRQIESWCRKNGVEIYTGTEVTEILQDENGRVRGLIANIEGVRFEFEAEKGVVFCTGGYSHNPEYMLQFQRGPHYGGCAVPTNTGDFIRLGGGIGARIGNTAGAFRAQSMIEAYLESPDGSSNVFYLPGDSMIQVNKYGRRIMDEKRNYTDRAMLHFVWDPSEAEWTNLLTVMLFDQRTAKLWQGFPPLPEEGQEMSYLIQGEDLEQLAARIGERVEALAQYTGGFSLDSAFLPNLKETIQRYNAYAEAGVDQDFRRGENAYDREWTTFPPTAPDGEWPPAGSKNLTLYPIADKGPYYAILLAAGTLDTNGGPVINQHAQVLDWNDQPIPGLYGAGNCIASPAANAYWGAGSTIGPGLTFGYIAAKHLMGQ